MTTAVSRKLDMFYKVIKVITEFYSSIILKKLKEIDKIKNFRNVENLVKSNIKFYWYYAGRYISVSLYFQDIEEITTAECAFISIFMLKKVITQQIIT